MFDSSSSSSLSTPSPFTSSLLPPPPVPSRSRSQETLRASPSPILTDPLPARPSSTNPFTGPVLQQNLQRRSLTPDFSIQRPAPNANLHKTMSAFTQPLIPTPALPAMSAPPPAAAPMSLFGASSTLSHTPVPLLPLTADLSFAPPLPLAQPSSTPPGPAPQRQLPPPGGKPTQQWVTFDDDLDFPALTKTSQIPVFPSKSVVSQTSHSLSSLEPDWLSPAPLVFPNLPPPIAPRTITSKPKLPETPGEDCFFPRDSTER